jgi:hypothetical protein
MKKLLTTTLATACAFGAVLLAHGATASAQSTPAEISLVHGIPGTTVDIVVAGDVVIDDVVPKAIADISSFAGRTLTDLEVVDVETQETIIGPIASITVPSSGNWSIVAYLDAAGEETLGQFENNLADLEEGTARLTLRHTAEAGPVDLIVGDQRPITGLANGGSSELVLPDGELADAQLAPTGEVAIAEVPDLDLVANTNTIVYAIGSAQDDTVDFVVQVVELPVAAPPQNTTTTTTTTTTPTPSAVNTGSPIDSSPASLALYAAVGGLAIAGLSFLARRRA